MSHETQTLKRTIWMSRLLSLENVGSIAKLGNRVLHQARGGSILERALAGVSLLSTIGENFFPQNGPKTRIIGSGFQPIPVEHNILTFLTTILRDPLQPPTWVHTSGVGELKTRITVWEKYGVVLLEFPNAPKDHWNNKPKFYGVEPSGLCRLLADSLWGREDNIHGFQMVIEDDADSYGFSRELDIQPNTPPGDYVGDDLPERTLKNLINEIDEGGRVLLLVGPTGTGKTTFAHKVVSGWPGNGHRILKISGDSLKKITPQSVSFLAKFLRPTVLLLDDIPFGSNQTEQYLDLFDSLRGNIQLVIATFMDEDVKKLLSGKPGSLYWPGMRPGRVDEIQVIPPPEKDKREAILRFYLQGTKIPPVVFEQLLEATENFTGAFLKELAHRISKRGWDTWETEVSNLRCQVPAQLFGEEKDEKSEKGASSTPSRRRKGNSPC